MSPQKAVLSPSLEKIFGDQQIAYIPCLCDVRGYIAQGKQILIDEELEYSKISVYDWECGSATIYRE